MIRNRYIFLLLVLLTFPLPVRAGEFRLVPSISAREEYSDNIFLTSDGVKNDFITTVSPAVEVVRKTERLHSSALVRLERIDYMDSRELNATDQTYQGKFRYLATPLLGISAEAGYTRDSRPDRDIGISGLVLSTVPRNRINISLSADDQLSEEMAVLISYAFDKESYDNSRYVDNQSHNVNTGLTHDLGRYFPGLKGRVNLGYSAYVSSGYRNDGLMGTVGFSRDFNELWSILLDGGLRFNWSESSLYGFHYDNHGWGWVGTLTVNRKGERGEGSLSYGREMTAASGVSGMVERDTLTLAVRKKMTEEFSIFCSAGYTTNQSDSAGYFTQAIKERTLRINPGVRYEFSRDIALEASYDYTAIDNLASNTGVVRNLFSIRLYMQHPFLE